jgi:hypothetical protein
LGLGARVLATKAIGGCCKNGASTDGLMTMGQMTFGKMPKDRLVDLGSV